MNKADKIAAQRAAAQALTRQASIDADRDRRRSRIDELVSRVTDLIPQVLLAKDAANQTLFK